MAEDPEARTQLARLLRDDSFRLAPRDDLSSLIAARFDLLVEGLVAEAAASDDVFDRESAMLFVGDRLHFLASVINSDLQARLRDAVREKIEAW